MTVNTTNITSGPYAGNDITTEFSYTFRVADKTQLSVYETDDLGVQSLLVVDTDYTVAGVGVDVGGLITRVAGGLPTNYSLYIRANYIENQLTAFASQGGFLPDVHEAQMDHITFLIQQLRDTLTRSFALSDTIDIDGTFTVSDDAVARASKRLGFDASGNLIVVSVVDNTVSVTPFMETLLDDTTAAAGRATLIAAGLTDNNIFTGTNKFTGLIDDPVDYDDIQKWSKGADVVSAAALALGTDGNSFDITAIAAGITGATQANPVVITAAAHGLADGDTVTLADVGGMTELNGNLYTVANKTDNTFELSGIDGTAFTAYTSGGAIWASITSIDTFGVGTWAILHFDGILRLDHSSNIVLPGAANITTDAGRLALIYEYAAGKVRVFYQKPSNIFVNNSNGSCTLSGVLIDLDSVLAISTWESIGPTSSGADNIWTALDNVPDDIDWIEVRLNCRGTGGSASSIVQAWVYARANGSSIGITTANLINKIEGYADSGGNVATSVNSLVKIPVNSLIFDAQRVSFFSSNFIDMILTGYGYNS